MELNSSVNTFHKGLNLDSDISVLDNNTIRYAENVRLVANSDGTSAVAQNSDYIQKYNFQLPIGTIKVLGVIETKYCECENEVCGEPQDCAVVFVKEEVIVTEGKPNDFINKIYRVTFDENTEQHLTIIAEGDFGWKNKLSLVANFESCNVSNVYVADGEHPLRVINVANQYGYVGGEDFDMFPTVNLTPFKFDGFVTGNLKAGKVQYAYQLFNQHGTSSSVSPMSDVVSISETIDNNASVLTKGSPLNSTTQLGVKLRAAFNNNGFNRLRIYRIFYDKVGQVPTIYIADEISISADKGLQEVNYSDFGSNYVSLITVDEFNALTVPYQFVAQTIESKDNRLFAANVKEDTWSIDYDARAYRADIYGNVVLKDSSRDDLTFRLDEIPDIDVEHDCLNPSNMVMFGNESFKYAYNRNGKLGGSGKNVSYEFTFVETVLSDKSVNQGQVSQSFDLNVSNASTTLVNFTDDEGNIQKTEDHPALKTRSYSDAYMCSKFLGYQRDEIYRFGIVFYNKKGIATPVYWIGDIRIPCNKNISDIPNNRLNTFQAGVFSEAQQQTVELLGYAIGIKFTVSNIPDEAVSYEIVRCERTGENRTIVTQAAISSLIKENGYDNIDKKEKDSWLATDGIGTKGIYPQPFLNFSKTYNTIKIDSYSSTGVGIDSEDFHYIADNYYELISPEICVSQNEVSALINSANLCRIGNFYTKNGYNEVNYPLLCNTPAIIYKLDGTDFENVEEICKYITHRDDAFNTFVCFNLRGYDIPSSGLFKYYSTMLENSLSAESYKIETAVAPKQIVEIAKRKELKSLQTPINNNSYLNLSVASKNKFGRHGKNIVIYTEPAFAESDPYCGVSQDFETEWTNMNRTVIYNVKTNSKIFNGVYSERLNSTYISCNAYGSQNQNTVYCFGGDTYLGVLDYLNTAFHQETNDYADGSENRIHTQCYIPFETTVNLNLFNNKEYHNTVSASGDYAQNLIQSEPVSFSSYVQTEPQYAYNAIYSQQADAVKFVPKLRYSYDDLSTPNRIITSEVKTNLELSDSWMQFKYANYLDVDNRYGPITNLKTFGDKLYFFQDNAVGIASVNERSLITDNIAQLTIGTGDVLTRYDYLDTTNGDSIINDRSIVNSASTLYWYDYNKNEICAINNSVMELSKVKQVQSYFNQNKDSDRTNPVSLFNKKYNEIWFKVLDKTLVFSEQLNSFTSFYTHDYDYALTFGNKLITLKNRSFYEHNETIDSNKTVEPLISKLDFAVNENYMYTKAFDNVLFDAHFNEDINNITNVYFTTKQQTSEQIGANEIECREDTYRFAIPREVEGDNSTSYQGRIRGKYLMEHYTFDCNDNKTFKIPYIKTTYRQSKL